MHQLHPGIRAPRPQAAPPTPRHAAGESAGALSRRHLLTGALLAAVVPTTGVMARGTTATPAAPASEWRYTDWFGQAIVLPAMPTRIAATLTVAAALWDTGLRPVAVFDYVAISHADGNSPMWGNVDPAAVAVITDPAAGVLSPELALTVDPDLFITMSWLADTPYHDQIDPAQVDLLREVAPVLLAYGPGAVPDTLAAIHRLAAALGAALESPANQQARTGYEATLAEFQAVTAAKPDLTVSFVSVDPDNAGTFWQAGATGGPDIELFSDLGLTIVAPDEVDPATGWAELSSEQAGRYAADVTFFSVVGDELPPALLADPIFGQLPAVRAGQAVAWNPGIIMSYQALTALLALVLNGLRDAGKVTG